MVQAHLKIQILLHSMFVRLTLFSHILKLKDCKEFADATGTVIDN